MIMIHMAMAIYSLLGFFGDKAGYDENIIEYFQLHNQNVEYQNKVSKSILSLTFILLIIELPFLLGIG
jgi:hypothetical protein